jgi:ABC-type thiamine transport system substrate-binding protein
MIGAWSVPMTENIKLPRKLSEEQEPPPPPPRRPSHADVIENLDRWANSPGLQPPKSSEEKTA